MRHLRSARGVSLVELMIATAITAIALTGAITVVRSQQKSFNDGQRLRGAQTNGRRALLSIEEALPRAGFGMDASLALDLAPWYAPAAAPLCPAGMGTCPRDAIANSDELVFYARDPRYWIPASNQASPVGHAWTISAVTSTTVSINARTGDVFRNGQIFLAVCPNSSTYAYFTAGETVTVDADGSRNVTLANVVPGNPFRRQDVAAATACFTSAPPTDPARLFLVDRYRFHVRPEPVGRVGTAIQYDPLLVLDQGIDSDGDGDVDDLDEQLVAEGIESIQVSYQLYSGLQAGATPGTTVTFTPGSAATATATADTLTTTSFPGAAPAPGETVYGPTSFYGYAYGPPPATERNTNHQANVEAIRIAVLARSATSDLQATAAPNAGALNQNALPAWVTDLVIANGGRDGYQRIEFETAVTLPNMSTRAMTYF